MPPNGGISVIFYLREKAPPGLPEGEVRSSNPSRGGLTPALSPSAIAQDRLGGGG